MYVTTGPVIVRSAPLATQPSSSHTHRARYPGYGRIASVPVPSARVVVRSSKCVATSASLGGKPQTYCPEAGRLTHPAAPALLAVEAEREAAERRAPVLERGRRGDPVARPGQREAAAQRPLGERVGEALLDRRARSVVRERRGARAGRRDAGVELAEQLVVDEVVVDDVAELVQEDHRAVDRALAVEQAGVQGHDRAVAGELGEPDRLVGAGVGRARRVQVGPQLDEPVDLGD